MSFETGEQNFSAEPLTDGTKRELFDAAKRIVDEHDGFAAYEPVPNLVVRVARTISPEFILVTTRDTRRPKTHLETWDFEDEPEGLDLEFEYSDFRPRTIEDVKDDMKLLYFIKDEDQTEEQRARLIFLRAEHEEHERAKQEGLFEPKEAKAQELIKLLGSLSSKDLKRSGREPRTTD